MEMTIKRGEQTILRFQVKNNNGGVIDLTGLSVDFQLTESFNARSAVIEKSSDTPADLNVVNAERGQLNVYINSNDAAELNKNLYYTKIIVEGDEIIHDVIKVIPYVQGG